MQLLMRDRLFGHVTTGLWQRHVSRLTKLYVRQRYMSWTLLHVWSSRNGGSSA